MAGEDDLSTRDFAFYEELGRVLTLTEDFLEKSKDAEPDYLMGLYLRMAARSMVCVLEMFLDYKKAQGHG